MSYSSEHIKNHRNIIILMIFSPLFVMLSVFGIVYVNSRDNAGAEPPAPPAGQQWNLVFSDEFNDTSVDLNKWEPSWFAGTRISKPVNGNEQSCFDPSLLAEGGGSLTVTAVARNCTDKDGRTYNYASGLINSREKYTFTYGYFEARMWLAPGSGSIHNWPQFWANGTGTWPTTGEIDVMEGLGGRACYHFHYSGGGPGSCPSLANQSGWHTYGADWQPGVIKFYYDNQYVGQITSGITSSPMYLIAALGISSNISGPIVTPSTMKVDYIRVYQHVQGQGNTPSPTPPPPAPTPPPPPPATLPPTTHSPTPSPTSPDPVPISVPGSNPIEPITIPKEIAVNTDGTITADFNGDGLNDVVKDVNEDGLIDPSEEIVISSTDSAGSDDLSQIPRSKYVGGEEGNISSLESVSVTDIKLPKPVLYTFLVSGSMSLTGVVLYIAVTKLTMFASLRGRMGL